MFSVVIPLYNKAHTIINTLESVLNQTFPDFEVVIVNDGSTDNAIEVIKNNFSDSRIRIINQENKGVSAARNLGVRESRSELIAFLDGDDELLPEYLSKMKEAIEKFPDAGMYCCAGIVRESNGSEHLRYAKKYKDVIQEINYFENPFFFTNSSSTIIKKSEFNKTEGFPLNMKINEDLVFFCSLALITPVIYCPFPLSVYLKGVEGQASGGNKKIYEFVISRTNQVFHNWLKTNQKNKLFLTFTKYEMRNEVIIYLRNNDYEALDYLIKNLDARLLKYFSAFEFFIYKNKSLKLAAMSYIYFTKSIWKLSGFPIVQFKKINK